MTEQRATTKIRHLEQHLHYPELDGHYEVRIGGEGRNRTDECSFCRAVPYHLATPPSGDRKLTNSFPIATSFAAIHRRPAGTVLLRRARSRSSKALGVEASALLGFSR